MAHLVRVGATIINLDRMTHAVSNDRVTSIYFSEGEEDYLTLKGEQHAALHAYLTDLAPDVLAIQAQRGGE